MWFKGRSRRVSVGVLAVCVLIGVAAAVFAWQARGVETSLRDAGEDASQLQARLIDGDSQGARLALTQLQGSTKEAHASVDGVLWRVGSSLPFLGEDIAAVRTIATELDRVADQAIPPIVDASGDVSASTFSPRDGRVGLDAIADVAPALEQAQKVLNQSHIAVNDINVDSLTRATRGPVQEAKSKIDQAAGAATNADLAARLLPGLLGADGPRRYLLLNQNNAEIRPTGGIPGSFAIITAADGELSLGDSGSIQDVPTLKKPVLPLTDDERSVFPNTLATDLRDINITPDFPRTAAIAQSLVEARLDITVDGVLSVDPVALSYLLDGTGPITLKNKFVLTQDNAVETLLNRVYVTFQDPAKQDRYFASATQSIFTAFSSGAGDPTATLKALVRGIEENRITFWSASEDEQELIGPTSLGGQYIGDDGNVPHVGVYLSDAASTKMEYYLDFDTEPVAVNCLAGERQVISTTTTLTSTAPDDSSLPPSVTGTGDYVPRGSMRLNVRIFAPHDGKITSVRLGDTSLTVQSGQLDGRRVTNVSVLLAPGESKTVTANMTSGFGQIDRPIFTTTPGVESMRNDYSIRSACGMR